MNNDTNIDRRIQKVVPLILATVMLALFSLTWAVRLCEPDIASLLLWFGVIFMSLLLVFGGFVYLVYRSEQKTADR